MVIVDIGIPQTENIQSIGPAHRQPLLVHLLDQVPDGGGDAVHIVTVLLPALNAPCVEQNRQRVDHRVHVVQAGLQHVGRRDELRVHVGQIINDTPGVGSGQGGQRQLVLYPRDGGHTVAGSSSIEQAVGLAQAHLSGAAGPVPDGPELQCAAGGPGADHHGLPVRQAACKLLGHIGMGKSRQHYKDDLCTLHRLGHILRHQVQLGKTRVGHALQLNAAPAADGLQHLRKPVIQGHLLALQL